MEKQGSTFNLEEQVFNDYNIGDMGIMYNNDIMVNVKFT
jgi:hypothetical protein